MSTATMSLKRCVNCHKDVTHGKRMKDSSNRYWCMNCGLADQKKKEVVAAARPRPQGPGLMKSLRGARGGADKGWLIKMLIVMGLLAAGALWRFSTLH